MKYFLLAMLLIGMALLGVILAETNLAEVWERLHELSWFGLGGILLVYLVGRVLETGSWLFTIRSVPFGLGWLFRLWKVLMFGSAMEMVTPLAGLGGEPIKAMVLKRHYGIPYGEATASLVLTRVTDTTAQILFIALGLVLVFAADLLPLPYQLAAILSLALFSVCILLFFLAQRHRAFSRLRGRLERGWLAGRSLSRRAVVILNLLHDIEDRLVAFYTTDRRRVALSIAWSFCEWISGAIAAYLALDFLGHPISFADAIVIEAFMVLVRSMLFFVPGDIGTQEGALVLICGAITGSATLGLALAAIRRARDLLFIVWGLAIGSVYSFGGAYGAETGSSLPPSARESIDAQST